jgi:LAO/AO transport system kinase
MGANVADCFWDASKSGVMIALVRREKTASDIQAREAAANLERVDGPGGLRLEHLGVAVKSIAEARVFYEALGMRVDHEEIIQHEQVKVAMLSMGESRLELLEAYTEDSVIGRFLAKRGEGLHHIALKTTDVDALFARLKEKGVRLATERIQVGAGGHRYFFVHPQSAGGVLVEIVGEG